MSLTLDEDERALTNPNAPMRPQRRRIRKFSRRSNPQILGFYRSIPDPGIVRGLMTTGSQDQAKPPNARKHVLIVDDDELVRTMTREVFERVGLHVADAVDGADAIVQMAETRADLVVLDVLMPEKEGIETLIQLKKEYPETKIIMISSGGRKQIDDFLAIAHRLGADAVLKKPIKPSVLLSHATELLWGQSALPVQPVWKKAK